MANDQNNQWQMQVDTPMNQMQSAGALGNQMLNQFGVENRLGAEQAMLPDNARAIEPSAVCAAPGSSATKLGSPS